LVASRTLTRRQAILVCASGVLTVIVCAVLLFAAALVPAPPVLLPFIVVVCLGCAMAATAELTHAIAALRAPGLDERDFAVLRRQLAELPETDHPLGL
jgi:cobalamin biosynthesis protein CobD/CbiB